MQKKNCQYLYTSIIKMITSTSLQEIKRKNYYSEKYDLLNKKEKNIEGRINSSSGANKGNFALPLEKIFLK